MVRKLTGLEWVYALALVLFVLIIYYPVSTFSFINFDDNVYITTNQHVTSGLTWDNVVWAFTDSLGGHWHPLTWIAHMCSVEVFGLNSGRLHLVDASIHALNAALLFAVILKLTEKMGPSLFIAGVFGIHPMRLESVAWLSELKDVLSMFFALLTILAYVYFAKNKTLWWYLLVICAFILGILSKPTILTLPALLLLLDFWPLERIKLNGARISQWKECILEKIPLLLISISSIIITSLTQNKEGSVVSLSAVPMSERFATSLMGYLAYLGKLFAPIGLGIFYPLQTFPPGVEVGALIGLLAITLWCIHQMRLSPYLLFGWSWFIIALSPVIGIIQFGGQSFADRWSYLPHIGLLVAATWWFNENIKITRTFRIALSTIIICSFATWTELELPNWKDSISIFSHTLQVSPNNFMAHTNLGSALDQVGREEEAGPHYEEAARLNPTYPEAINNLGILRARQGRYVEASQLFQRALSIRPNFSIAQANYNLAISRINSSQ